MSCAPCKTGRMVCVGTHAHVAPAEPDSPGLRHPRRQPCSSSASSCSSSACLTGLHILFLIGCILALIGLVLLCVGAAGNSVGGRRYWF